MKRSYFILCIALAMFASACGGGSESSAASAPANDFPPPSLTSQEVCDMIGTNDIVAIFDGVSTAVDPSSTRTGCWYSVWDGNDDAADGGGGETTITLLNNGGAEAYDAELERWSSIATVTPIADFVGDAVIVEKGNGNLLAIMHEGGNWVWEITLGVQGDAAVLEEITRTVAGHV